jgi:hypothetical protein
MSRIARSGFLCLLSLCIALPVAAADARMTAEERAKLVRYLKDSEAELVQLLADVSENQWNWKAGPDRWSIAQTASHIAISEGFLSELARKAMDNPADPDWEKKTAGKTELLERVLPDRSRKVQAPEPLNPGAVSLSKAEVLRRFREGRAATISFAQTTELPLREHITPGLFAFFDPLNAYHFELYIPLHNLRHNKQIAEVKAAPGYPAH